MNSQLGMMVVLVVLIVVTGGTIVLAPLGKRLGDLIEALTLQKRTPADPAETVRTREALASLDRRLDQLEERQNFMESLVSNGRGRAELQNRATELEPPPERHRELPASNS